MSAKKVLSLIKEKDIKFVDLRFTDLRGKWQHTTQTAESITEESFEDGIMFDGSSIAGWKDISESDMILKMDTGRCFIDPFAAQQNLVIFCDVLEPSTGQAYGRDPRSLSKAAETYLKNAGIGDTAYFGP